MYLNYYGLKKQPFHITPDPEFLYLSPSHKEALAAMIYGIEQRKGFVAITGDVGVGKTTILRSYLEGADKKHLKVIYIFNAKLTFEGLLKTIYQEMDLEIESNDVVEMVNKLYRVLIEEYNQGNTIVLVIDEAQNMPVRTLESLRMISNLETSKDKLIQIVLVGQSEFDRLLKLDRLRQLRQRLAVRAVIQPLTDKECLEYIRFRLQKAGAMYHSVFTDSFLKKVVSRARGIPRLLNVLCDNALVTGFGYQQRPVTGKIAGEIIRDYDGSAKSPLGRRWFVGAASISAVIIIILAGALLIRSKELPFVRQLMLRAKESQTGGTVNAVTRQETVSTPDGTRKSEPVTIPSEPVSQVKTEPVATADRDVYNVKVIREVVPGDTLSKMAKKIYGDVNDKMIDKIRKENPQIADPNLIHPGSTVLFPKIEHE